MAYSDRVMEPERLSIRSHQAGTTQFLSLNGELDHSHCAAVEAELARIESIGAERIVIDLSEVEFIDSTGIALLVAALRRDGENGRMRFIRSESEDVQRLLELCGLEAHLPYVTRPSPS